MTQYVPCWIALALWVASLLLVYFKTQRRIVRLPLTDLDIPYSEGDCRKRGNVLIKRLARRFESIDAYGPFDCRTGDVLLFKSHGQEFHLGIVIDGVLLQMAQKDARGRNLRVNKMSTALWSFVEGVYRHRDLVELPLKKAA
jgi:hypothetical protein